MYVQKNGMEHYQGGGVPEETMILTPAILSLLVQSAYETNP